jgi:alpha-tubulin suppressor-like RCC1 family protein
MKGCRAGERAGLRAMLAAVILAALAAMVGMPGSLPTAAAAGAASAREEARPTAPGGGARGRGRAAIEARPLLAPQGGADAAPSPQGEGGISLTPSRTRPYYVCPDGTCQAIVDPEPVTRQVHGRKRLVLQNATTPLQGSGEKGGFDPQDLQSAYDIPTAGGAGETIGIVDANGFVEAEHALAVYRERYGLPPCTTANGCFRKVNQKGQEGSYPGEGGGWATEQALDIEMVSAACPECHILLVQASEASDVDLGAAENTAVKLGAIEISNSWSSPEQDCGAQLTECEQHGHEFFEHPGVMLFFAAGDNAYDNVFENADSPDFPASLPSVVAVGGTVLRRAGNARGWTEEPWYEPERRAGGGSGCSRFAKPSWQVDPGCPGRMTTDVAADGACESPMSVYAGGWENVCGTSASSPLLAGIEAHAESSIRSLPGAEAFYEATGGLYDITTGINGKCSDAPEVAYFCRAEPGYDGPTGNGTPDGPLQLAPAAPLATTAPPSAVGAGQATLHGSVSPRGLASTYAFEYGTTTDYGSTVPVPEASVGTSAQQVTQTIAELQGETVYHYRLVAHNADGTSYGADYAFSTSPPSVTGVSPGTGAGNGGETVRITGENLLGATSVSFGSRAAPAFTVESNDSISAQAPAGTGAVQVTVTTPAGSSGAGEASRFIYDPPGAVLAWGRNQGMLGDGEIENSEVPVEVTGLGEAQALSAGWTQSLALLGDGGLMAWGENVFGTVGDGSYTERNEPVRVCALGVSECPGGPYLEEVTAISAGRLPSLALLKNGTVAAWGGNLYGDLATDTERNPYPLPVCTKLESPCQPENYLQGVVEIAAGADFSLARLSNGTVMAWGENTQGELGQGTTAGPEQCGSEKEACSRIPRPVSGLGEVTAIAAGSFQGLALLANGTVMSWGANELGQLGDGATKLSTVPVPVCAPGEGKCKTHLGEVQALSGAFNDSFALLKNGTVAAWGYNGEGGLGDATTIGPSTCTVEKLKYACATAPSLVAGLSGVRALAQGEYARGGLAELSDGRVETWGADRWGELGDARLAESDTPVGVCVPFAYGPCPEGPFLEGTLTAFASGSHDLLSRPGVTGPSVSSLTPSAGPAAGGTRVAIVGGELEGATAVHFGAAEAENLEVRSDDEVRVSSPPGSGTVAVTVTTPQGTSPAGPQDQFTYEGAPTAITGAASHVEADAATLSGSVDPGGENVRECLFEYGTSPAYGSSVPCSPAPGSGTSYVPVSAALTSLQRGQTYYFRVAATNAQGTGYGAQQTFTTPQFPELGRCVKSAHARYTTKTCTTPSAGADSGKYEWEPWPLANPHLTLAFKSFQLESGPSKNEKARVVLECKTGLANGEYTGPQSATMTLVLSGCSLSFFGNVPCTSEGAAAGEVVAQALPAQLGIIHAGAKPSVGWALGGPAGATFAAFECSGFQGSLTGSVIAAIGSPDKSSQTTALTYKGSEGSQTPESFEGGLPDVLALNLFPDATLSLDTTATIDSSEAVEVRAQE